MLEMLCNAMGVSGDEDEVREIIYQSIKPYCHSILTDNIGNLIAFKKGKNSSKKIMLCAHMDEVGLIIKRVTDGGYIKFECVGGIDGRILPGKRVIVGKSRLAGVIGIKAVHMTTQEERKTVPKADELYIDIGAKSKEEAMSLVELGDYIMFDSPMREIGDGKIMSKALDNRVGCNILMELLKEDFDNDIYACFTVQEEIGLRGATVAAAAINADIAIILETTICADIYDTPPHLEVTTLGGGPALSMMERTSYSDRKLVRFIKETAKNMGIPCQYKRTGMGGNEAGAVQVSGTGATSAVISVPCRYIHSPVSVIDKNDYHHTLMLAKQVLCTMDRLE